MVRTSGVRPRRRWPRVFGLGLLLWAASVVVTLVTGNPNLVPTLILLGSFLVPVTFVLWAFETWRDEDITAELIVTAFVVGGLLGILGASVLETYLLHPSVTLFLGVGLIEEAVKLLALVLVTRGLPRRHTRDGVVLGAAVGFGFAAFESAGYAFNAVLTERGLSVGALVQSELLRGVLAPVGHGLWTAILGGVLFGVCRDGRARLLRPPVLVTLVWVALLHALWDAMPSLAVLATFLLTGSAGQQQLLSAGYLPSPTDAQARLLAQLQFGGMGVVAVLGLLTLGLVWWRSRAEQARYSPLPGPRAWVIARR
ncbi:MAG TPA: PrsW family glutamic-type intramembrane protease [Kineosporiaceae bacterium]|nr:PrsW family glutamic-type intramembrane protease [Kineosporiaceae bacterium]